jgi:hypothetical protein
MSVPVQNHPRLPPVPTVPVGLADDEKYRGITPAMDKAIEALHQDGWSVKRLFTEPNAVIPLPPKFPSGRVYLFADNVAVVANESNGGVIAVLPINAALHTLFKFDPESLLLDEWAAARWEKARDASPDRPIDVDPNPRWWRQSWFDRDGSMITVTRTEDGAADIHRDRRFVQRVADDDEAENLGLHPVTVELVALVTGADPR